MPERKKGLRHISEADQAAIHVIARSSIGIAGITYDDQDDIKQELTLKLIRKAHLFRRRRQKWGTFRKIVLQRCMSDIIRSRTQPGFSCCFGQVSLNTEVETGNNGSTDEVAELIDMITTDGLFADNTEKPELPGVGLKIDMDAFLATLPYNLRRVCETLKKYPVSGAAGILHISRRTLYRRMEAIKIGMKTAGFEPCV